MPDVGRALEILRHDAKVSAAGGPARARLEPGILVLERVGLHRIEELVGRTHVPAVAFLRCADLGKLVGGERAREPDAGLRSSGASADQVRSRIVVDIHRAREAALRDAGDIAVALPTGIGPDTRANAGTYARTDRRPDRGDDRADQTPDARPVRSALEGAAPDVLRLLRGGGAGREYRPLTSAGRGTGDRRIGEVGVALRLHTRLVLGVRSDRKIG